MPPAPAPSEPHQPVLAALVAFSSLYYAFRYPLQYNSSLTSAAYRDTPFVLKAADDAVILLLLFAVVLMKIGRGRLLFNRRHVLAAGAILLCFAGVVVGFGPKSVLMFKGVVIYSLLLAVTTAADLRYLVSFVFRYLLRFYVFLLVVDGVQILLYLTIGRPPALAWGTDPRWLFTQTVRFGSLWDDPNSFGLFLVFIVTWVLFSEMSVRRKILLIAPALFASAASWSRTCLVLLVVAVGGFLLSEAWTAFERRRFLGVTTRVAIVGGALAAAIIFLPAAIGWANEDPTAEVHLRAVLMRGVGAAPLRLGEGRLHSSESVFTFVARNGGWLPSILLLLVLSVPMLHLFRFGRLSVRDKTLVAWAGLSILSFFAIPFLWIAPMGLLFFIVYGYLIDRLGRASGGG